jgi:hypothetical protein
MKRALLPLLACCTVEHHVTLQLGPTSTSITSGFNCTNGSGTSLFANAITDGQLSFRLVVDLIDVGDHTPDCLAEDVEASCTDGSCHVSRADAPTRFCGEVNIAVAGNDNLPAAVGAYLAAHFADAIDGVPDHPVIVRAFATTAQCSEVQVADGPDWATVTDAPDTVLGCAFSCPINLDEVNGIVELGANLDLHGDTPAQCQAFIDACATFPSMN